MVTALLFDLDGTLADTDPIHFQTWQDILQPYNLAIDPAFYRAKFSGRRNQEIIQELLPHLSPPEAAQLSLHKEAEFRNRAETQLTRLAGLSQLLTWTDEQTLKRAVVTNAPIENAQFMLRVLALETTLTTVVLGDELPMGKPDPLPYQVALNRLGVAALEAIAFEDSTSGIRSAVGAGIPTIGVATTHAAQELYAVGATLVISDFSDPQLWDWLHHHHPLGEALSLMPPC
jgi:HAD superfamily hydrolase (TIGR01509 family)